MQDSIIKIDNLSKKYTLGSSEPYYALRDQLAGIFKFGKLKKHRSDFWALRDINLDIKRGEAVGIIGRNGAGKSTLLKILSQITPPTKGSVTLSGRVASLLEVGTGFHPELTGRENIYLNGAILGMTKKEIAKKFDEIVAFSEIEKFLDTPVKRYSSGMYVRLAFAVAAHLEPEILIVDEVLAVGDAQFQKKCLGKMGEVGKSGRTVLFVSHNMAAIAELCNKCVLLDGGKIIDFSDTGRVVNRYLSAKNEICNKSVELSGEAKRKNSLDSSTFKFAKISVVNSRGNICSTIGLSESFAIKIEGWLNRKVDFAKVGLSITSNMGVVLFNSFIKNSEFVKLGSGKVSLQAKFSKNFLAPGVYSVGLGANGDNMADWIPEAISFEIEPMSDGKSIDSDFYGLINHPCDWNVVNNGGE